MTNQDLNVSRDSIAIQSGRDTTINHGLTPDDMKQIIETVAAQLPVYAAVAREIVEARLGDFETRILERFANPASARTDAFKDPDFQYMLGKAQHAYARSGEESVKEALVDLIAQRSLLKDRNRLALSLNEAIERAAVMTKNEFAELSLVYLLKYTETSKVRNVDSFCAYINEDIAPFLPHISTEESSYSYLESQSCTSMNFMTVNLADLLKATYGGIFAKGLTAEEIDSQVPEDKKKALMESALVVPCLLDMSKFQFNSRSRHEFYELAKSSSLQKAELDTLWNALEKTMWSKQEMIDALQANCPCIAELFRLWDSTPLKQMNLTTVGTAIGHANSVRVTKLEADLAIWIK